MSSGIELLRMLEPAVRPGGLPGPIRAAAAPIESRSFESLLEEATSAAATTEPANEASAASKPVDPLSSLARVELIGNAELLHMIGAATAERLARPTPSP